MLPVCCSCSDNGQQHTELYAPITGRPADKSKMLSEMTLARIIVNEGASRLVNRKM